MGTKDQRDNIGGRLYAFLVGHLQKAVRLTPERRLQIAESVYAEATMQGDSVAEAELFLSKWRRARHLMFKEGVVPEFLQKENTRSLLVEAALTTLHGAAVSRSSSKTNAK